MMSLRYLVAIAIVAASMAPSVSLHPRGLLDLLALPTDFHTPDAA